MARMVTTALMAMLAGAMTAAGAAAQTAPDSGICLAIDEAHDMLGPRDRSAALPEHVVRFVDGDAGAGMRRRLREIGRASCRERV